jgi:hypothetical protein
VAGDWDRLALRRRIEAARAELEVNLMRAEVARTRLSVTRELMAGARSERQIQHTLALARLNAHLESLPVIEQAKGVLMAQAGCEADEAFKILRRASRRTNINVREAAADIVRRTSASHPDPPKSRQNASVLSAPPRSRPGG